MDNVKFTFTWLTRLIQVQESAHKGKNDYYGLNRMSDNGVKEEGYRHCKGRKFSRVIKKYDFFNIYKVK